MDHWLQEIVHSLPSYIQDTTHFLNYIKRLNEQYAPFTRNIKLVTIDVVSLYANIPQDELLTVLRQFLEANPSLHRPRGELLIEAAKHVITSNFLHFEDQIPSDLRHSYGNAYGPISS